MTTHFIDVEVDLTADPAELPKRVEAVLAAQGEPLRWAIAAVNPDTQMAQVEAVVTRPEEVSVGG